MVGCPAKRIFAPMMESARFNKTADPTLLDMTTDLAPDARSSRFGRVPGTPAWQILLSNALASTTVALVLWLLVPTIGRFGFWPILVHSLVIGNGITLLILIGGRWKGLGNFDTRLGRWVVIPTLAAIGVWLGLWVSSWLIGAPRSPMQVLGHSSTLLPSVVVALIIAPLLTMFWRLRHEQLLLRLSAAEQARRAESARLAMLRAQVEPHMLFNTLANLRALIRTDPSRAVDMLDHLDSFLRATLDRSRRDQTTLADEFGMLDDYLSLMKVRLGGRLDYSLDLPAGLGSHAMPALLLQPAVENAIRHGIEPSIAGGRIDIKAARITGGLEVTITDTGVGLAVGADGQPIVSTRTPSGTRDGWTQSGGFGLTILRERLAALPGGGATMRMDSPLPGLDHGTCLRLFLPLTDHD